MDRQAKSEERNKKHQSSVLKNNIHRVLVGRGSLPQED